MNDRPSDSISIIITIIFTLLFSNFAYADDGYSLWLNYKKIGNQKKIEEYRNILSAIFFPGTSKTCDIAQKELKTGLETMLNKEISFKKNEKECNLIISTPLNSALARTLKIATQLRVLGREGFLLKSIHQGNKSTIILTANNDIGILYGTFHLLRLVQTQQELTGLDVKSKPKIQFRLLNHWDNLNGTVERGYAGNSLWKWNELPDSIDSRYRDYARVNASLGINGAVLNNVNANPSILKLDYLKKIAKIADVFRPFGIHVFLSVNFSSPLSSQFEFEKNRRGGIGDLSTSDPLIPEVRQWWKNKVKEIYQIIPDFGGFLVKANSEGMPGPQEYKRTHADGANMLADALEPYKGIVMWRAFVYEPEIDTDRVKRAYKEFAPLDGQFSQNVFIQAKNGPLDFQPREPIQPLFGSMPKTPLMLELQITQEYLGHSTHLVYLAPMWKEYFEFDTYVKGRGSPLSSVIDGTLHQYKMTGIAGVTNIGDDRNWCGHTFAQANWYAFGRLAWDHSLSAEQIAREWIAMTLSSDSSTISSIQSMMLGSWEACINYMTPLGLHHIMQPDFHYGPGPDHAIGREDWRSTYYHRADSFGLGFNRSSSGSKAVGQYFLPVRKTFNNISACPEKYLLWFHHIGWNKKLQSGHTLWEELCIRYYSGTNFVDTMISTWKSVEPSIDSEIFLHVQEKLQQQKKDAIIWRDTCLHYFQKFNNQPIFRLP